MSLIVIANSIFLSTLLIDRMLILSIPLFRPPLHDYFWVNISSGIFSDLMVGCTFAFISFGLANLTQSTKLKRGVEWLLLLFTLAVLACMAINLRYLEYFGMHTRPFHLSIAAQTTDMWTDGWAMMFESWRAKVLLVIVPMLALAATWLIERRATKWNRQTLGWKNMLALIVAAAITNSANINTRMKVGVHTELRYSPLASLYYNSGRLAGIDVPPSPSFDDLNSFREAAFLSSSYRVWHTPDRSESQEFFPLMQSQIPSQWDESSADSSPLLFKLRSYLQEQERKHGPWNVIMILQESLRAHELESFGNSSSPYKDLTPNMSKIFREGIRFTEMFNVGVGTRHGQLASLCGLPAFEHFAIVSMAPTTRTTCISDMLAGEGYSTYFLYGADNHFDNQYEFYSAHQMQNIIGSEAFAVGSAKGGWGFSDHELFKLSLQKLRNRQNADGSLDSRPFFATILTLSNHGPHSLPSDAPPHIDRKLDAREQLLQYVDWSWGEFYRAVAKEFPHTIIVTAADHGMWYEDDIIDVMNTDPAIIRKINRIPMAINIPNLPKDLATEVKKLASNADIPPTILSMLGRKDVNHQFMGMDAFVRNEPVLMNIYERLYVLRPSTIDGASQVLAERPDQKILSIFNALAIYNLIAPAI
jgi:phosphoglycerol transferase MdoB-like AlkP superfamily enzyme